MIERLSYGADPLQFGEISLPETPGPHRVVVVIHGGFWRAKYDLEYIRPACDALTAAGLATWNLEYRRIGNPGGGWQGTFEDVATGLDYLFSIAPRFDLDPNSVIAIGHSAGGHLAFWLASCRKLAAAISLAGVLDLRRAWELQLSNTAVADLLGGGPDEVPGRYAFASPIERLPLGIPQKLFHGTADTSVPLEISDRYVKTAQRAGDDAELITLQDADHFALIDPRKKEFHRVRETAVALLTSTSH